MPFSPQYFARLETTQNLDKTYNPSTGLVGALVPSAFVYNASATGSNESAATTQGANYFLPVFASLSVGDTIYVTSNDPTTHFLRVLTSTSGGVTTSQIA